VSSASPRLPARLAPPANVTTCPVCADWHIEFPTRPGMGEVVEAALRKHLLEDCPLEPVRARVRPGKRRNAVAIRLLEALNRSLDRRDR